MRILVNVMAYTGAVTALFGATATVFLGVFSFSWGKSFGDLDPWPLFVSTVVVAGVPFVIAVVALTGAVLQTSHSKWSGIVLIVSGVVGAAYTAFLLPNVGTGWMMMPAYLCVAIVGALAWVPQQGHSTGLKVGLLFLRPLLQHLGRPRTRDGQ